MLLRKIIGPVGTFGLVAVAALALAAPAQAAAQDQTSVTEDQTLVTDCETTATSHEDCGWKFDPREPKVRDATCDHEKGFIRIPDAEDALYFINGKKAEPGKHWLKPGIYEVVAIKKKLVLSDGADMLTDLEAAGGDWTKRFPDFKKWFVEIKAPKDCPGKGGEHDKKRDDKKDGKKDRKKHDDRKKDDKKKDDDKMLPVTGPSTPIVAGGAVALLVLGGGMYLLARQRRVRFTA